MSSFHYSTIAAILPSLIKKTVPYVAKRLKLAEIDDKTREKVKALRYPRYYAFLFGLWNTAFVGTSFVLMFGIMIYGPKIFPGKGFVLFVWLGILNLIGALALWGGFICAVFWRLSSERFRDYVRLRQIQLGNGYVIEQQIGVMIKIGVVYYLILLPVMFFILRI